MNVTIYLIIRSHEIMNVIIHLISFILCINYIISLLMIYYQINFSISINMLVSWPANYILNVWSVHYGFHNQNLICYLEKLNNK